MKGDGNQKKKNREKTVEKYAIDLFWIEGKKWINYRQSQ